MQKKCTSNSTIITNFKIKMFTKTVWDGLIVHSAITCSSLAIIIFTATQRWLWVLLIIIIILIIKFFKQLINYVIANLHSPNF